MFSEEGKNIPCTIIEAGPCTVTQIKTIDCDGYDAVQIAYDNQKESRLSKALLGHLKKAKAPASKKIAEVSFDAELSLAKFMGCCIRILFFNGAFNLGIIKKRKNYSFNNRI